MPPLSSLAILEPKSTKPRSRPSPTLSTIASELSTPENAGATQLSSAVFAVSSTAPRLLVRLDGTSSPSRFERFVMILAEIFFRPSLWLDTFLRFRCSFMASTASFSIRFFACALQLAMTLVRSAMRVLMKLVFVLTCFCSNHANLDSCSRLCLVSSVLWLSTSCSSFDLAAPHADDVIDAATFSRHEISSFSSSAAAFDSN
mmetsp:Transcript_33883/g.89242  ORF Transcript_33883/g.89242 Transcript_33883/m.89242 type:complete len:202 (+) Transcript_33883:66-671(+)